MPMPDLTNEEYDTIVRVLSRAIREDPFPFSRRLAPMRSALIKLARQAELGRAPTRSELDQFVTKFRRS
jgi:hypothetical protein